MKNPPSTILITGASRGIGAALARELAKDDVELLLVARNAEDLKSLAAELQARGTRCECLPCDLSRPEDVAALAETVAARPKLDGLIHNAGIGLYGKLESLREADMRELFEINFFSVLTLTRRLLPLLKQSPLPRILLVSSVVSWRAIAGLGVYCASKFALNGFAEALRVEVAPHGIKVVNTYPGRTRTNFSTAAKSDGWKPFAVDHRGISPEKVARKLARAYRKGKRDEFVSFSNRLLIWANFCFPRLVDWGLEKLTQK
ncbi:MAG TPA: short chain dehydrogenase [Deltaproteobacteria bacterium]|nr:short chain dehydrogenase [Deltaproteobacteria bacterium]